MQHDDQFSSIPHLKTLRGRELLQYLWDYFRYPALAVAAAAIFLGSMIIHYIRYEDPLLTTIMINAYVEDAADTSSFEPFFQEHGYEMFDGCVSNAVLNLQDVRAVDYVDNYSKMMVLLSGELDLVMGNGPAFQVISQDEIFEDLRLVLSEEDLEALQGRLVYAPAELGGYPCAVEISGSQWLEESGYYSGECWLAMVQRSAKPEIAENFIRYVVESLD